MSYFDGAKPCGEVGCRVCVALGFLPPSLPAPRKRARARRPGHHPLDTKRAIARASQILAFMLSHQRMRGLPPTHSQIMAATGLRSSGLVSIYMRKLEQLELVRQWRPRRWMAVPQKVAA